MCFTTTVIKPCRRGGGGLTIFTGTYVIRPHTSNARFVNAPEIETCMSDFTIARGPMSLLKGGIRKMKYGISVFRIFNLLYSKVVGSLALMLEQKKCVTLTAPEKWYIFRYHFHELMEIYQCCQDFGAFQR